MAAEAPTTKPATVNLGSLKQVPVGEGRCFLVGRVPVVVFRSRNGEVFATQALCTHKGGPLADGLVSNQTVVCPLHGNKFNLATGQPIDNECKALKTYAVSVEGDELAITLADAK